jgi:hypothetical protein
MSILSLLLAIAAFVLLGIATDAHHRRCFRHGLRARERRMLRTGGWLAMVVSFVAAIVSRGWTFGPILWTGAIMAGAGIAFLALNFLPARANVQPKRLNV